MTRHITFLVPGDALPGGYSRLSRGARPEGLQTLPSGRLKAAATLASAPAGTTTRGGTAPTLQKLQAEIGLDVVVLHLAGDAAGSAGPVLVLHPETARDLLRAQAGVAPVKAGARRGSDTLTVPATLGWAGGAHRGGLKTIALKAIEIISNVTGLGAIKDSAIDWAEAKVLQRFDGQVDAGLYRLQASGLAPLKDHATRTPVADAAPDGGPLLVLLHGTFSDTPGTFGKLWEQHADHVQALFRFYGGRVYALDHPTLGVSPIANALALARSLPAQARVHLLTHSRGGLVAEVLARVAAQPQLTPDDLGCFADQGEHRYTAHRADLLALATELAQRQLRVERVLRVACPARGTLLASRRVDAYLSVLQWALQLAHVPVLPQMVDFLAAVAQRRTDPAEIPGLEAMLPDGPLVRWLNPTSSRTAPLPGDLRVVAGDLTGGSSLLGWVKMLMADALYWQDNDLVVHTAAMFGGGPRAADRARYARDEAPDASHFDYFANPRTARHVLDGLTLDNPAQFRAIGAQSWAGQDSSGTRGVPVARTTQAWHLLQTPAQTRALPESEAAVLEVEIVNGNLRAAGCVLLMGHYRGLRLSSTEAVMDQLLGGTLSAALLTGIYPEAVGRHRIFAHPNPAAAGDQVPSLLIAGLGEEGSLGSPQLTETVRLAVIGQAQKAWEQQQSTSQEVHGFTLAATLLGSGGTGVSPGLSAQAIVQGVLLANERLAAVGWPGVSQLQLIELYLDRATDAWRALAVLQHGGRTRLKLAPYIRSGSGPLRRPLDAGYRATGYDYVTAVQGAAQGTESSIIYTLDTRRARTELRAQATQGPLVRQLIAQAAQDGHANLPVGASLFQLLVPAELEPFLTGSGQLLLELDEATAAIPWELLAPPERAPGGEDSASGPDIDPRPWAIRCQLLRKLRTAQFRSQPVSARRDAGVLVVGEPRCDRSDLPPLPGARAEALQVAALLRERQASVTELINEDALPIVNTLLAAEWRVIHVAGHGLFDDQGGGVVLSGDALLGPREILALRTVPELVFVNCCHLAHEDSSGLFTRRSALGEQRPAFAANVARQLIGNGVRCVVACGWAVGDAAALAFAEGFYGALLDGQRFIEAVSAGRLAAWQAEPGGNTWAAYQCYGDPNWVYIVQPGDADGVPNVPRSTDISGIASAPALILQLEALIVESLHNGGPTEARRALIGQLQDRYGAAWGAMGVVQEAFGLAYAQEQAFDRAITCLQAACTAADASASLRAAETLCQLLLARAQPADLAQARTLSTALHGLRGVLLS